MQSEANHCFVCTCKKGCEHENVHLESYEGSGYRFSFLFYCLPSDELSQYVRHYGKRNYSGSIFRNAFLSDGVGLASLALNASILGRRRNLRFFTFNKRKRTGIRRGISSHYRTISPSYGNFRSDDEFLQQNLRAKTKPNSSDTNPRPSGNHPFSSILFQTKKEKRGLRETSSKRADHPCVVRLFLFINIICIINFYENTFNRNKLRRDSDISS